MAIEFDGVDDAINCGTMGDAVLTENGAVTISAWVYPEGYGENNGGRICGRELTTLGPTFRVNLNGLAPTLRFHVDGSTDLARETVDDAIIFSAWQNVILTWDGSTTASNVHIYIDGIEATYQVTQNMVSPVNNSTASLRIGDANGNRTFDGQISEVAVWTSVLSATDIALLAKSKVKMMPLQVSPSTLEAYWPLDDFADGATASGASSIVDRSGKGNHGTPSNSPVGRAESVLSYPG